MCLCCTIGSLLILNPVLDSLESLFRCSYAWMHQLAYWASYAVCNVSQAAQALDDQVMLRCLYSFMRLIARKYGPMPEVTGSGPSLQSARHVMSKQMRVITHVRPVKLHERHNQPSTIFWMRSQYWQSFSMWAIGSV